MNICNQADDGADGESARERTRSEAPALPSSVHLAEIMASRRDNLRTLIVEYGGKAALGRRLGYESGAYLYQVAGESPRKNCSEAMARHVEASLGLPPGWMDKRHAPVSADEAGQQAQGPLARGSDVEQICAHPPTTTRSVWSRVKRRVAAQATRDPLRLWAPAR